MPASRHDIARHAVVLDTCVLVAAFCSRDQYHQHARDYIDQAQNPLVVPIAVLVEAWGRIVGSLKDQDGGEEMLRWVTTPGQAQVLPQGTDRLDDVSSTVIRLRVDCVDALISHLADDISAQWGCAPYITIATYDTRHFWNCRDHNRLRLMVQDLRSDSSP